MKRWRENQKLLGAAILHTEHDVVFKVGTDTLSRFEVATVLKHTHVGSIRKLERYLNSRQFKNMKEAIGHVTLDDLAFRRGIGSTTIYVWMTLLEHYQRDPMKWLKWDGKGTLPTLQLRIRSKKSRGKLLLVRKRA